MNRIDEVARGACLRLGVEYRPTPADGRWHALDLLDDPKGKQDARIKIFPGGTGGLLWNHKSGAHENFFANSSRILTNLDRGKIAEAKERAVQQISQKQAITARKARFIHQHGRPATSKHDQFYMVEKNIAPPPNLLRIANWHRRYLDPDTKKWRDLLIKDCLIAPMLNEFGAIENVQAIFPKKNKLLGRNKDFLPGGRTAGLFCPIGQKTPTVCICEGLATAISVNDITNFRTYAAFSAANLEAIALLVKKHRPQARIIVCGDNDASGVGQKYAEQAAEAVNGLVCWPPETGDFNDYINNTESAHG
ncbi:MAG: toprim domain-containing protein [Methylococcales bacterium]